MTEPSPPPGTAIELLSRLAQASDEKLLEVVRYLNSVPATAEILALLEQLRPKLRDLRPPRALSLKRLWCRPFEDLLVSAAAGPASSRVPRAAIEPSWALVVQRGRDWLPQLEAALSRLQPNEPQRILEIGDRLWPRSAEALGRVIAADASIPHLAVIRDALLAGSAIEAFKRALPNKPLERLDEPELVAIESGLRGLVQQEIPTGGFLLAIAARLRNPAGLLVLQKRGDVAIPTLLRRQLAAMAISAIDDQARNLERLTGDAGAAARDVAREAEQLMKNLLADHDELDEATRKELASRSPAFTGTIRTALDECVIKVAPERIEMALPGSAKTTAELIAAEEHAQTFGRSRGVAAWAGLERQAAETARKIAGNFEEKLGELLDHAERTGDAGAGEKEIYRAIRIIELIEGPQRAQQVLATALKRLRAARG